MQNGQRAARLVAGARRVAAEQVAQCNGSQTNTAVLKQLAARRLAEKKILVVHGPFYLLVRRRLTFANILFSRDKLVQVHQHTGSRDPRGSCWIIRFG